MLHISALRSYVGPSTFRRARLTQQRFPEYVKLWDRWREVVSSLDRQFLKVDAYALSAYGDNEDWGSKLVRIVDCIEYANAYPFDALDVLLGLASINHYGPEKCSFRPLKGEPDWSLVGGNVDIEIWPGGGKSRFRR